MRLLGNIIWLVFGGIFVSIGYLLASIPLIITIIGIPFGIQTVKLAILALWPFGKTIKDRGNSGGCLCLVMNIIWLVFGGLEICLLHLFLGLLFCITIIGIPFGKQHFKLAALALTPFGKEIY
ncbi:MAG: YccF domain-containing protein [Candidatus Symbiothrix sp.]|jgi:uncharacterized membrane protein YccF (DUF307 family)|nr:YccF domain-containing protein [Candidatus Symbiothrix sp.]